MPDLLAAVRDVRLFLHTATRVDGWTRIELLTDAIVALSEAMRA